MINGQAFVRSQSLKVVRMNELNLSDAWATFIQCTRRQRFMKKNTVMLVFI